MRAAFLGGPGPLSVSRCRENVQALGLIQGCGRISGLRNYVYVGLERMWDTKSKTLDKNARYSSMLSVAPPPFCGDPWLKPCAPPWSLDVE